MNIADSVRIRNRVHVSSVVLALVFYVAATVVTFGLALLVLLPLAFIAFRLSGNAIRHAESTAHVFKKSFPLNSFGVSYGDFEHVFHHTRKLESEILETVIRGLRGKTPVQSIDPMTVTDHDRELKSRESRLFLRADAGLTERGTTISLVMQMTSFGAMQSVHWWVLGGGYVDRNKRFNFAAYAGLTLWFWIIPFLKDDYDLLPSLRTVYPGYYNSLDITTRVRCLHEAVFDAMVTELDRHGIDTSDIKVQRAQVMNISVSGGKLNVGNLVQGAGNRVAGRLAASMGEGGRA